MSTGRPAHPRRQRLRHNRQAGPPGDTVRTGEAGERRRIGQPRGGNEALPLQDERIEEREETDAIRRPEGEGGLFKLPT